LGDLIGLFTVESEDIEVEETADVGDGLEDIEDDEVGFGEELDVVFEFDEAPDFFLAPLS
jgi:hypothetical protein